MMGKGTVGIKMNQIELRRKKKTLSEGGILQGGINRKLDVTEEKVSEISKWKRKRERGEEGKGEGRERVRERTEPE